MSQNMMLVFFAENVLVFNGKTAIDNQPLAEDLEAMKLQPHNMLAAHMFNVLTDCQAGMWPETA